MKPEDIQMKEYVASRAAVRLINVIGLGLLVVNILVGIFLLVTSRTGFETFLGIVTALSGFLAYIICKFFSEALELQIDQANAAQAGAIYQRQQLDFLKESQATQPNLDS